MSSFCVDEVELSARTRRHVVSEKVAGCVNSDDMWSSWVSKRVVSCNTICSKLGNSIL